MVVATYYTVFTLTQLPIGVLAERVDRKGLLTGCGTATALAFVGLFLAATALTMGLCIGGLGASLGAIFVQTTAWVAELAPAEQRSLYMAFFDAIIDLSFIVMPGLVGLVAGLRVQLPFLLCALLASGATLVLTFAPRG